MCSGFWEGIHLVLLSGNAIWWIVHMASTLCSRLFSFPCPFHRRFPKALWLRSLTSNSNRNDSPSSVSVSSLLKGLRRRTPHEREVDSAVVEGNEQQSRSESELKDDFQSASERETRFLPRRSREGGVKRDQTRTRSKPELRNALHSTKGKEYPTKERGTLRPTWLKSGYYKRSGRPEDSADLKYNKVLRELRDETGQKRLASEVSSNLLDSLRKSGEESEPDDGRSFLEKSIEATRNRKTKSLGTTLITSETMPVTPKQEKKWLERSLEDLEKNLSQAEPSQKQTDPELNKRIKGIISELKVAPKQLGAAKTIVAAVESWGKSSFNLSQRIKEEYKEQTSEITFDPSELSLYEGDRPALFDNALHDVKAKNLKVFLPGYSFLMQSDHIEELDNVNQIGIWQNSFRQDVNLSSKLWQYPIDNEVCKVEEHGVSFEEHVFLEYLLDDFPSKGPVRRFMELVINGLQQNPHLNVEQKKERVHWFKDYFSNFSEEELNF